MTSPSTTLSAHSHQAEARQVTIVPAVDMYENDDELLVVADLPGVSQDAVELQLEGAALRIKGARAATEDGDTVTYARTFRVPNTLNADAFRAELHHGVLHIHMPKADIAKPRRIEVTASGS